MAQNSKLWQKGIVKSSIPPFLVEGIGAIAEGTKESVLGYLCFWWNCVIFKS